MNNAGPLAKSAMRWCEEAWAQGLSVYAVLDPAGRDHPSAYRPKTGPSCINLFSRRSGDPEVLAITPLLAAVEADDAKVFAAIDRQRADEPDLLLLASSLGLEALADRLDRRTNADADGLDMLLRWWDARIFSMLADLLNPERRALVLCFASSAWVPDRQGGSRVIPLPGAPAADPLAPEALRFTADELDLMTLHTEPDAILGMLRDEQPQLLSTVPHTERHGLARQQLHESSRRGFAAPRDHALALALAIEHGPHWWEAPAWAGLLRTAQEKKSLLDAYLNHVEGVQ